MRPTRADILAFTAEKSVEGAAAADRSFLAGQLKRAQLMSQELCGDPSWDEYLSRIKPRLEQAEKDKQDAAEKLLAPANQYQREVALCQHYESEGMINALRWCMELPKILMEAPSLAGEVTEDVNGS